MFTRKRQMAPAPPLLAEAASSISYEALRFLSQQELEPTPANYALAWYVKGDRASLVAVAADAILMEGRRLTQADVDRIMLADAQRAQSAADSSDPRQDALRHQTLRLADLTAGAASQSSAFERDLSMGLFHLSGGTDSTEQIVAAMVQRTRGVEAQLTAASKEIETLRQQVEATRDDAHRDALTGLLNRRGVLQELSSRRQSRQGVVALGDIDHFKSINDRFGHGVGDRVLKGVAASLSESIGIHTVARWGGEEFLIVLDVADMAGAVELLDQARQDLEARSFKLRSSGEPLGGVTISIGAASLVNIALDEAVEAADRMLYAAKSEGRNRVVIDVQVAAST